MAAIKELSKSLVQPFLAVVIGLLTGALVIAAVGESILGTYQEMWKGAFGSFYFFTSTLARATPIMLIALGLSLAFRAGVFNLGAEGQMVLGAVSAALVAIYLPAPGMIKIVAGIFAGMAVGGFWALLPGFMEARFRIPLLISTLLFNYIAVLFASYLVTEPFRDRSGSAALAQTVMLEKSAWLPKLFAGMSVHAGFLFAIVAALLLFWVLRFTPFGYEVKMLGQNSLFAQYGGINRIRVMLTGMFASGGLAGLAGTVEVMGAHYRFVDGALTVPGFAWTGLMAALLANSHPLGIIVTSILLAAFQTGAMGVERNTDVPLELASVIQAVLILFISAKFSYDWWKKRKAKGGESHGAL
ncbi:ABC transporter permease [Brevibacillus formosus]|jgi:general nucleoside transport system permease protein|uniref:ABC transporter permease n=1 Tax=Brevibacillus formosus TaxID=54913 RepID=A0A0H0SQP5_9BACL|nr:MULTISPECIES: ABC transporter permease [Brevibacillus]ATF16122.1 ABC transporter permease [Brevibacillus brevis X23]ASJ56261.1 ABC transporter permease [Brevibacillus formosus]KLH99141.1 ABC transporter permease [Brevibacillus formosus]MBG9942105.1 ABC transporter permease [Brevibacillus formosus]MDC0761479.1 ABC transporter permease [Brevibacillus sp. AG]